PVVGCLDEYLHLHRLPVRLQIVAGDLAYRQPAIVDGRTGRERSEVARIQDELLAGLPGNHGRNVQPDVDALSLLRRARLEADVVAGEQRGQTGGPAQGDLGTNGPESRILDHQGGRVLFDLRGDLHLPEVVGEAYRLHLADVHVLVLDEGLARLDAFSGGED